jgi:acetyl-CoA acetyltransferase
MHPFGRFPEKSHKDLARTAVVRALADAGLGVKDVEAVYSANALGGLLQGQEQIRGQSALRDVGLDRVPIVNVENACASGATAFNQAVQAIRAGSARVVLACGFEKMFVADRDITLGALESAADVVLVGGLGLQFTAVYAMRLRRRLDEGVLEPRDLVEVTVKSHHNASLNSYAQHRKPLTAAEIEAGRPIAEPLTLPMCSSVADGAAAVVLIADRAGPRDERPTVTVRGTGLTSGFAARPDEPTVATNAARRAYEDAGIEPEEVDVAEVHDAMAPGELLYYEQLGFCERGGAAELLHSGATALDGSIPVNPSGGLCSRGHAVGATGLAQVAELTWQLRGEAGERQAGQPRIALAQNSGGWMEGESAACGISILAREQPWT